MSETLLRWRMLLVLMPIAQVGTWLHSPVFKVLNPAFKFTSAFFSKQVMMVMVSSFTLHMNKN